MQTLSVLKASKKLNAALRVIAFIYISLQISFKILFRVNSETSPNRISNYQTRVFAIVITLVVVIRNSAKEIDKEDY
jgi:hypothetical protein